MASEQNTIPKWLMQQTPSIGGVNRQVNAVTPDDLNTASQMYGKISSDLFALAGQIGLSLNYIHPDYQSMQSSEAVVQAEESFKALLADPVASKDGPSFRKAANPIMLKATEGMGFNEAPFVRRHLNNIIASHSLSITDTQAKHAAVQTRAFKDDVWSGKNSMYLSKVDPNFSPEEKKKFMETVRLDQRNTLLGVNEQQHQVYDAKFEKLYEAAEIANPLIADNFDRKKMNKMFESKKFQDLQNDPEKLSTVMGVLKNGLELRNARDNIISALEKQSPQFALNNFSLKYDGVEDLAQKRDLYNKEKLNAKDTNPTYYKELIKFGKLHEYEPTGSIAKVSQASADKYNRMGLNGEKDEAYITKLYRTGALDRRQYNAYMSGAKMRKKTYETYDNKFNDQIKSEFGFSTKQAKGPYAGVIESMMKQSDKELRNYNN